jgi:uncharacterized phage protein gp47/JayE
MEIKTFDQIYSDMRNYIIAHQDKLTDFNDGGVLMSQIEATAREMALLYINCRVGFSSYLRSLPYSIFNFSMKEGEKASTEVVLSRSKPFSYETPIPAGTIVAAGTVNFLTTQAASVRSGEKDSLPVSAIAQNVGDRSNVAAGAIKTIVSTLPADIVKVSNPGPATGGENAEDWAAYAARFADFILGLQRTNNTGILTGLTNLVRSMGIVEHFPPINGIWNMTLYLEDGSGSMTPEALAESKRIIDGNIAAAVGGYRAPGINIQYLMPEIVPVTTNIIVTTERDIASEVDQSVIVNEVKEAVQKFINGKKIGESILISDLIVVLKRLSSLSNVHIPYPEHDIMIIGNQIVRYEDCIVTVVETQ